MLMLAVLVSYQALLIGIGLWTRRRSQTHDDFLIGGFGAVSITDSPQAIVMFVAALILPVTAIVTLGCIGPIFSSLSEQHLALTGGNMGWMAAGFLLTVLFYSLHNTVGDIAERVIPFVVGWLILWLYPSFLKRTPENKLHRPTQVNIVKLPLGSIPRA